MLHSSLVVLFAFVQGLLVPLLTSKKITALSRPFLALGFITGSICSFTVMSGDNFGRVNLFYLLVVFWLVPVIGAFYSAISLSLNSNSNIANLFTHLPFWPTSFHSYIRQLRQEKVSTSWFFYQTQGVALCYTLGGMSMFLLMLVITDINFVWRSTVINDSDFHLLLSGIALPWRLYLDAQPSLELIQLTQDSRLDTHYENTLIYGSWWKFILLTQLFYGVLVRLTMLFLGYVVLAKKSESLNNVASTRKSYERNKGAPKAKSTTDICSTLPQEIGVINWASLTSIELVIPSDARVLLTGTIIEPHTQDLRNYKNGNMLVITKSWEPPLGELSDFLAQGSGFIFPIDMLSLIHI